MALTTVRPQGMGFNTGRRNLIINGAMQVAQRGTSVTGITSGAYRTCDRIQFSPNSAGTWTVTQSTDAPDGFGNSFKIDCTAADASLSAGDFVIVEHKIESQNVHLLDYGSSSAKTTTASFYVKSNKTGTYVLELRQVDTGRLYSKTYTIDSANTWERKTLTFPGDVSGAGLDNDNGQGLNLNFWCAAGSTYSSGTIGTSWHTTSANRAAGVVNIADSTDNEWLITGIQLEVGENASDFEHRSFGEELALCQRYFFAQQALAGEDYYAFGMGAAENSGTFRGLSSFPVTMRIEPSLTATASNTFFTQGFTPDGTTAALDQSGRDCAYCTVFGSGGTAGYAGRWLADNTDAAYLFWSAEL